MYPNLSSNMHLAGEKLSRAHRSSLTACTHSHSEKIVMCIWSDITGVYGNNHAHLFDIINTLW